MYYTHKVSKTCPLFTNFYLCTYIYIMYTRESPKLYVIHAIFPLNWRYIRYIYPVDRCLLESTSPPLRSPHQTVERRILDTALKLSSQKHQYHLRRLQLYFYMPPRTSWEEEGMILCRSPMHFWRMICWLRPFHLVSFATHLQCKSEIIISHVTNTSCS